MFFFILALQSIFLYVLLTIPFYVCLSILFKYMIGKELLIYIPYPFSLILFLLISTSHPNPTLIPTLFFYIVFKHIFILYSSPTACMPTELLNILFLMSLDELFLIPHASIPPSLWSLMTELSMAIPPNLHMIPIVFLS